MYEMTSKPLVRRTLATLHASAHAAALRAILHGRRLGFRDLGLTALAHELIDSWHK
jgi:hypothetical protein